MTDVELLACFLRGLIPGPQESEEAFVKRVANSPSVSQEEWSLVAPKTRPFGYSMDWMQVIYSNQRLAWWEGAATWICPTPFIQLKVGFQRGSYLGYDRLEILAHEAIHAARIEFNEPQFEEVLAYSLASQSWKRFVGPLFNRSWEPLILILAIVMGWFWFWIPLTVILLGLSWLGWRQWIFKKRCRTLPLPVILCLTDREIREGELPQDSTLRSRLIAILFSQSGPRDL